MTERAFPTDADRRALIAIRATALRRIVEPIAMASEEEKTCLVLELMDFAQNSDTMALPLGERRRTELDIQILERDPALDGEARDRILDLSRVLTAEHWPLPWYAVESRALDNQDRAQIARLVEAFAAAGDARDEAAAMRLYAIDGDRLEMARRWFLGEVCVAGARLERVAGYAISPRFDARTALLGDPQTPPLWLRSVAADGSLRQLPLGLSVVRTAGGWRLE